MPISAPFKDDAAVLSESEQNMKNELPFTVDPLNIGARIIGLDLRKPIDTATRQALYATWMEHALLIFPASGAGPAEQIALSRCFGELEKHPVPEFWVEGEPNLIEIGRRTFGQVYVYDESFLRVGRLGWHRDTSFTPNVCKGAMLRMDEVPPRDGETLFCDTALAYDALPDAMKTRLEGLEFKATTVASNFEIKRGAPWRSIRNPTSEEYRGESGGVSTKRADYPSVIHPVIISHPESGRKCIYISPIFIDCILGLPEDQSEALIDEIVDHMTSERFCYTHEWVSGEMILWDNRRLLHGTLGYDPQYRRVGFRTTLADPMKTGRYYEEAEKERVNP